MAVVQPQSALFHDGSAPVFRACASAMQRPTLTNVRIRSTRDANQIFYAVLRNVLPMTVRRLDAEERRAIASGNVYVWEERGASSEATGLGIERWTDGMRWSPSRVRDEFLFYHQKEMDPEEAADLPPTRWARIVRPKASSTDGNSSDASPDKIPHQRPESDPEKLIKQTYSVLVALPEDRHRGVLRKWHLTAYFTQATVDKLSTVDEMLPKPQVMVPEGLFRSARAGKIRRDTAASRQHQQQRQIAFARGLGPAAAGPSGSSSATAYPSVVPSSTYSPRAGLYAHVSPRAYPHAQYSAYTQEHRDRIPGQPPVHIDAYRPPTGASYTIAPGPPPPPPPPGHGGYYGQGRGLGITYHRPPRDREYERDGESTQELHRERDQVSPQRIPPPLPNTYDPTRQRIVGPPQSRSPSYSHPYANALPSHYIRTTGAGTSHSHSNGSSSPYATARPLVSKYYSPAKPIEPIEVDVPRHAQPLTPTPPGQSSASDRPFSHGGSDYGASRAGDSDVEMDEEEYDRPVPPVQRESEVGPIRSSTSPSPSHRSTRLPAAPLSTDAPSSPRPQPASALVSGLDSNSSGAHPLTPNQSPVANLSNLEGERVRALVPLDSLENAVFPRRDPTDDALLRRFNTLRTTPPASTARDE
ncbi:uncharacterized protein FOMMEDRAFT_118678 [Fomitiporia mediterranea MF3/22]|uniref:uncharacterized protein n=1 Tax=Fomitiporia mediterranea (strain MF3/22) TaxID=694068 RepID=UPI00044087BE|nr:uncharacterized protein FOMMEDRAFT_118678 [Fomitiporia mediterranea MF3/22]EJD05540.1 hypothetical protein FOMMEDRAFT_118678 [Fomitiporia mediterranea MF3/22]